MAKRKRLTPAQPTYLSGNEKAGASAPGPLSMGAAPIAQVASDTSASAALEELSGVLERARTKGLMIEELPLDGVDETYLVRDRIVQGEDDMQGLMESLKARGQHTPIEVVKREDAHCEKTHGLISGWRRLTALRRLYEETSDPKFATIKALVVRPESAADAYLAMVEENEIRVNLSHYERARIAVQALAEGVYPDQRKALLGLFQNVPRAKRSKIASFVTLVEALDDVLRYPTAIPEKLGLGLARAFAQTPQFAQEVAQKLRERPCVDAEGEQALLSDLLAAHEQSGIADVTETPPAGSDPEETPQIPPTSDSPTLMPQVRSLDPVDQNEDSERGSMPVSTGVHLDYSPSHQRIELTGPGVDTALLTALKDWLRQR